MVEKDLISQQDWTTCMVVGRWAADQGLPAICEPDLGLAAIAPRLGVAAIGASGWVTNVNVPLATADMQAARSIARAISARGGGLQAVEAMALPHTNGEAIACVIIKLCCVLVRSHVAASIHHVCPYGFITLLDCFVKHRVRRSQ